MTGTRPVQQSITGNEGGIRKRWNKSHHYRANRRTRTLGNLIHMCSKILEELAMKLPTFNLLLSFYLGGSYCYFNLVVLSCLYPLS